MADTKISALASGTPALFTDQIPIARGSGNYSLTPSDIIGTLYKGTWNASTNTPTLANGTGVSGTYYTVSTAGNTLLGGQYGWAVGDTVLYNGTIWTRIPGYGSRIKLSATLTLWVVHSAGNDANTGLTYGTAFKTIQGAFNAIQQRYDLNGYNIFLACDDSANASPFTETALAFGPWVGGGYVLLTGNGSAHWTVATGDCLQVTNGAYVQIQNFIMSTTGGGGCCINVLAGGNVQLQGSNMVFGACAGAHIQSYAQFGCGSAYTITGNSVSHWHAIDGGRIIANSCTVTLTGTPNFSSYFLGMDQGVLEAIGTTFVGSATGKRCYLHYTSSARFNSTGMEAALTLLPGSLPGTVERNAVLDDWGKSPTRINKAINQTAAFTLTLPAYYIIDQIWIQNTTANAVTGGIKVGTTLGGTDVVTAMAVAGNSMGKATLASQPFNATAAQTLYIDAVTAWNGANIAFSVIMIDAETV